MAEISGTATREKALEDLDAQLKKCIVCQIPCENKCGKCAKVGYCSSEHQRLHWKTHKENCYPAIRVQDPTALFGGCLVATRKIEPGELILLESALVIAPTAGFKKLYDRICLGCCKVLPGEFGGHPLHNCDKCSWPLCSKYCGKGYWHSNNECKIFSKQGIDPSSYRDSVVPFVYNSIKVLRILLLRKENPKKFQAFMQLEDPEVMKATSLEIDFVYEFITGACDMKDHSEEFIGRVLDTALLNSTILSTPSGPTAALNASCETFIYEHAKNQVHSCIGNTFNVERGVKWGDHQIYAATQIQRGEILTECFDFNKLFWKGTLERRLVLQENYRISCDCPRCSDPTELGTFSSAIRCKKMYSGKLCHGFYLPKNPLDDKMESIWVCNSEQCKASRKYSDLLKTVRKIENLISDAETVEQKLKLLKERSNISVHENHYTLMKLRFSLLPELAEKFIHGHNEYMAKVLEEFSSKSLEIADKLAPGKSEHRGVLLYYLAFAKNLLHFSSLASPTDDSKTSSGKLDEISEVRKEAKEILKVLPESSQGYRLYIDLIAQDC